MLPEPDACDLLCLDLPHAEAIRQQLPATAVVEAAAQAARALADPTRLTIAAALRRASEEAPGAVPPSDADGLCVCDVAWVVGQSQKLVSHHLRILRAAGLAASQRRGKMVVYSLTDSGAALTGAILSTGVRNG